MPKTSHKRQIVLDTETTGLDVAAGHRIIEIGAVEIIDRCIAREFHSYCRVDRAIDAGAAQVHKITESFLRDKPTFEDIAADFLAFVADAELLIHNAPFDTRFINAELSRLEREDIQASCTVTDTLAMARTLYPGQKNSLDALCDRLHVDKSERTYHGALLDARLLAHVYLGMTSGQMDMTLSASRPTAMVDQQILSKLQLAVHFADESECASHRAWQDKLARESDAKLCIWPD